MPYFESIALRVNTYAKLFDACLESTIHEKFLLIDSVVQPLSMSLPQNRLYVAHKGGDLDLPGDNGTCQSVGIAGMTWVPYIGGRRWV